MPTPTTRVNKLELNDGVRGLGWRPDVPDYRDHEAVPQFVQLPTEVRLDTTANMPPVYDQGQLGSCTANALAAAVEFDLRRQALTDFTPSRLFIYYNERVLERTVDEDAGAEIRDGAKTLHRLGVCPETTWPYDVAAFRARPPAEAYGEALDTRTVGYGRVSRRQLQHTLADGVPFTIGFTVYDSFRDVGDDGMMPYPSGDVLGGHAVLVCGYVLHHPADGHLWYRVRNSWGDGWGEAGYFWMPAEYLINPRLSADFWAIQTVS
jgi:C1A family cysteine protease